MRGSYHIATFTGIPLKIHWSFGLLLLWVAYEISKGGFQLLAVASAFFLVFSVFVCVILHEFGHALAARRFGVKTFDIIMTPIGGIARLEKMPEGRGQEFWVAIAGPLVNFVIAFLIWLAFAVLNVNVPATLDNIAWDLSKPIRDYFLILFVANFILGTFNLIPAFPMDGGRILRSLLSLFMSRLRATQIAALAGQVIAVIMFAYGALTTQPFTMLIGVFIFFAARQENRLLQRQALITKTKAEDLMDPVEHILHSGMTFQTSGSIIRNSGADSFIVWSRPGIPAGFIDRERIESLEKEAPTTIIDAHIIPAPGVVPRHTSIAELYSFMHKNKLPIALVADADSYIGVITWKKIFEFIRKP